MSNAIAHTKREVSISAVITREDGSTEDIGIISYWNKSRWQRFVWRLRRMFN